MKIVQRMTFDSQKISFNGKVKIFNLVDGVWVIRRSFRIVVAKASVN